MKIAVCFFGIPRYINENVKNIKNCLDVDADIFAHFWNDQPPTGDFLSLNPKNFYVEKIVDTRYHAFSSLYLKNDSMPHQKYHKHGIIFFDNDLTEPGWCVNPKNITSMWNSMSKSILLALAYSSFNQIKYERFILFRTDVVPSAEFKISKTFLGDVHKFLLPNYHPGSRINEWIPDHIISMSEGAAKILTFLPQFSYHYFYAQSVPLIPEIMLGYHMKSQGMNILSDNLYYRKDYKFWSDDGKI